MKSFTIQQFDFIITLLRQCQYREGGMLCVYTSVHHIDLMNAAKKEAQYFVSICKRAAVSLLTIPSIFYCADYGPGIWGRHSYGGDNSSTVLTFWR